MITTWRKAITEALQDGDSFDQLTIKIDPGELDREFDMGFGHEEGNPFTAWSKNWVYFPICYDGSEWVGSVPRNPCDIKMRHQGGG